MRAVTITTSSTAGDGIQGAFVEQHIISTIGNIRHIPGIRLIDLKKQKHKYYYAKLRGKRDVRVVLPGNI